MPDSLINRYRPKTFDDVVLNENDTLDGLYNAVTREGRPHAYLFYGGSGTGKTSLARVVARELNADVMEHDASRFSTVDSMRELLDVSAHMSLTGEGRRMIILNEVQGLSRQAWNALLTTLEEPPDHLYFALTTTERNKVPPAAETRVYQHETKRLHPVTMQDFLDDILRREKAEVDDVVVNRIVDVANGSPRHALSLLDKVIGLDRKQAMRAIEEPVPRDAMQELCKVLLDSRVRVTWDYVKEPLKALHENQDTKWENVTNYIVRTCIGRMFSAKREEDASYAAWVMQKFTDPANTWDQKAVFFRAVSSVIEWRNRQ